MPRRLASELAAVVLAVLIAGAQVHAASSASARQYLDEAAAAASGIQLAGDQSAARRAVVVELSRFDARSALEAVAAVSRPSDAARALGAAAVGLADTDLKGARDAVTTAGRLLLLLPEPSRRLTEQRLLLAEVAALKADALPAGPELPGEEAQQMVLSALSQTDPATARQLLRVWILSGEAADKALAAVAPALAPDDADAALEAAAQITSTAARDQVLWRIAEIGPPAEAVALALRTYDPLVKAGILSSAAGRLAPTDLEAALASAEAVAVSTPSALAEVAVALAPVDEQAALELARGLPDSARTWALGRLAVLLASSKPARAESLLTEIDPPADVVRLALSRMAASDLNRALDIAGRLPGEEGDAALAAVLEALAPELPEKASELVWNIHSPHWRSRAASVVASHLAKRDVEAATALAGLVTNAENAAQTICRIALAAAATDPARARRLLSSLPPSYSRNETAVAAARAVVSAEGSMREALDLAGVALEPDTAARWLVPLLATFHRANPVGSARDISDPYLRALALTDTAHRSLGSVDGCRSTPERARQVRPIVHWEGM
jgi:hypothetical protein